jgi:hypothetical protein
MATLPITADLKKIVADVAGKPAQYVFNDKRKNFTRRYKFVGIRDLLPAQVHHIESRISKLYPNEKFEVINVTSGPKKKNGNSFYGGLTGLLVKVL